MNIRELSLDATNLRVIALACSDRNECLLNGAIRTGPVVGAGTWR